MSKPFETTFATLRRGAASMEATEAMQQVVKSVYETGKPGKLVIELTVKPSASGLYLITVKIKDQPDAKPFVTVGCLDPFGYWEKYTDSEVLAFRELPEAYEKEKEK